MVKKIITTSLFAAVLLLSGCGESETEARLGAQQALDEGDFSAAISNLEAKKVKSDEDNMVLASSYMGEAGFSFTDTLNIMADSTSDDGTADTDAFASFAESVKDSKDENTLSNIQKAIEYYAAIGDINSTLPSQAIARVDSNEVDSTLESIGDRNLFLGFAYLTKATVVMSYLGDIAKLQDSQEVDEELLASGCAIVHVYSPGSNLPDGCIDVTDAQEGDYTTLTVSLYDNENNIIEKQRLATANGLDVLLTDYADANMTPILLNGNTLTIKNVLVNTINDAFDLIADIAPDDVQEDIQEFKAEIGVDASGKVTSETVSSYIANIEN